MTGSKESAVALPPTGEKGPSPMMEFEELVDDYHQPLYQFACSLSGSTDQAADLVEQAYVIWRRQEREGGQKGSVVTRLFSTLYREYLGQVGRGTESFGSRPGEGDDLVTAAGPERGEHQLIEVLGGLDRTYRPSLALFYLQRHSYKEIAAILDIPIGTVMSRISRGKEQLRKRVHKETDG